MPPFAWPGDPTGVIQAFETRRASPNAGALLIFALHSVDSLYYLLDIDRRDDLSAPTIGGHAPDVVDVAHARWATGTCVTALDLCAAGLGRALCGYRKTRELDLVELSRPDHPWRQQLPASAAAWVDSSLADPRYCQIIRVRHALTHSRITRHFAMTRQRLRLGQPRDQIGVPELVDLAREVATERVVELLNDLPNL